MRNLYIIITCFILRINATEEIIKTKIIINNIVYFYACQEFSKQFVRKPLKIEYPPEINLNKVPNSIVNIPFITNIITTIWFSGKNYTIDEMDEDLFYSLIKIKEFFKRFFCNTDWNGELIPNKIVKNALNKTDSKSAALFTGGLDSTTTVFRHFNENLSLISFNNAHETAINFARKYNFNLYTIFTNYYDFIELTSLDKASVDISKWFWDTSMSLSWIGTAAPFLYAKGIPVLYIPSGFTWQSFIFPDGQTLEQPACPLIDENLLPIGLKIKHDIFTMTRTEKIKFISNFCKEKNVLKPQLVVCNHHKRSDITYSHCNKCVKCYLTMLDIIAIGENLKDYGFTLSEDDFISKFKSYIQNLKMRRGGTYVALNDTQNYLKQNKETLSKNYQQFYDWFTSINLWDKIKEIPNRPLRKTPFRWKDYHDIYGK